MKHIHFNGNSCIVYCDCCDKSTEMQLVDYKKINQELEKQRWQVKYIENRWYDFCSKKCLEKGLGEK